MMGGQERDEEGRDEDGRPEATVQQWEQGVHEGLQLFSCLMEKNQRLENRRVVEGKMCGGVESRAIHGIVTVTVLSLIHILPEETIAWRRLVGLRVW